MTFAAGIPDFERLTLTPFGIATLCGFHEDGAVDLYVGNGRTFTVPGSTPWRSAPQEREPNRLTMH